MARKFFGLSTFFCVLLALVVSYFIYGMGVREGFYGTCSNYTSNEDCKGAYSDNGAPCFWITPKDQLGKKGTPFCRAGLPSGL